MMSVAILAVFLVFVTSCVIRVDSCYCMPVHPQQEYCTADYVIRARVKEKIMIYNDMDNSTEHTDNSTEHTDNNTELTDMSTELPVEIKYVLKTRKVFKTTTAYEEANDTINAFTAPTGNLCGRDLDVNKDYLISGKIKDGRLWIDYCNWVEEYNLLSTHQKRGIRFLYKNGCGCDVFRCVRNGCKYPAAFGVNVDHHCVWDRGLPGDCYTKVGICKKLDSGKCCWKRTGVLRTCTNEQSNINWCPNMIYDRSEMSNVQI